jgi:hypothetical protein
MAFTEITGMNYGKTIPLSLPLLRVTHCTDFLYVENWLINYKHKSQERA